jgi:hypothetical protein
MRQKNAMPQNEPAPLMEQRKMVGCANRRPFQKGVSGNPILRETGEHESVLWDHFCQKVAMNPLAQ